MSFERERRKMKAAFSALLYLLMCGMIEGLKDNAQRDPEIEQFGKDVVGLFNYEDQDDRNPDRPRFDNINRYPHKRISLDSKETGTETLRHILDHLYKYMEDKEKHSAKPVDSLPIVELDDHVYSGLVTLSGPPSVYVRIIPAHNLDVLLKNPLARAIPGTIGVDETDGQGADSLVK